MNRKMMISLVLFTAVICYFFLIANPVLSSDFDYWNYTEGEIFTPSNGHYDFGLFSLNNSDTQYFKVKYVEAGHVLFVDETGRKVINLVQFDRMINIKKDNARQFLGGELLKTSWMVDGVEVHEVDFVTGDKDYSASKRNLSSGTIIYLATQNDTETAGMINSLTIEE